MEKCRVLAPFAGAVLERQAQVGAMATPGTPLLRLVDLAPPEIEAQVQAAQADEVPGATEIFFETQGRDYPARLLRLSPVVDAAARTRVARLAFAGPAAPPGARGTLRWLTPGVLLPPELLVKREQGLGAFVVEDGRARFVRGPRRPGGPALRRGPAARDPGGGARPARPDGRPGGDRRRRGPLTCASSGP